MQCNSTPPFHESTCLDLMGTDGIFIGPQFHSVSRLFHTERDSMYLFDTLSRKQNNFPKTPPRSRRNGRRVESDIVQGDENGNLWYSHYLSKLPLQCRSLRLRYMLQRRSSLLLTSCCSSRRYELSIKTHISRVAQSTPFAAQAHSDVFAIPPYAMFVSWTYLIAHIPHPLLLLRFHNLLLLHHRKYEWYT